MEIGWSVAEILTIEIIKPGSPNWTASLDLIFLKFLDGNLQNPVPAVHICTLVSILCPKFAEKC